MEHLQNSDANRNHQRWGETPSSPDLQRTENQGSTESRPTRFMGSEHLQKSDVSCGHEPGRRLQSGTDFQPDSPEQARCLCHFLRFMGSEQLPK